jgi:hypothetical protein
VNLCTIVKSNKPKRLTGLDQKVCGQEGVSNVLLRERGATGGGKGPNLSCRRYGTCMAGRSDFAKAG